MDLSDSQIIYFAIVASLALLTVMYFRPRGNSVVFVVACFYAFFAFGPVINYLRGKRIYVGIVQDRIPEAAVIFTLALLGFVLSSLVVRQRVSFDMEVLFAGTPDYVALPAIYAGMTVVTIGVLLRSGVIFSESSKPDRIDAIGSGLHYNLLLIHLIVLSTYLLIPAIVRWSSLYFVYFTTYALYCWLTNERDVLFLGLVIMIYHNLIRERMLNKRSVMTGFSMICIASFLFAARSGNGNLGITAILNEGSLLFVDTRILYLVPEVVPFMQGYTYQNAVENVLPASLYQSEFNLSLWLVEQYGAPSTSSYGFSLAGEAYLNYGFLAVPVVFALVGSVQRLLTNRIDRHPFYAFQSVFFTTILMYSIRNDSFSLLKANVYAGMFFLGLHFISMLAWRHGRRKVVRSLPLATGVEYGAPK